MAREGKSEVQFTGAESSGLRKDSSLFDVAKGKDVGKEVKRRINQLRGGQTKSDEEKEKEEKLERARAAAWAWYEHGNLGGKESTTSSGSSGSGPTTTIRWGEPGPRSSRFRTEALKTSGHSVSSPTSSGSPWAELEQVPESGRIWEEHEQVPESGRSWEDFSNLSSSRTSSLFDSYELDSMSKFIEIAIHSKESAFPDASTEITDLGSGIDTVHEDEWPSAVSPPSPIRLTGATGLPSPSRPPGATGLPSPSRPPGAVGLPTPMRPPGAAGLPPPTRPPGAAGPAPPVRPQGPATPYIPHVVSISHRSHDLTSTPRVLRSSGLREQFPLCTCGSISDDDSNHEQMGLGMDIAKCECHKTRPYQRGGSGWSLQRILRAIQEFIHLPEHVLYHPQREHHERRHARLLARLHLHHYHPHDHESHLHYQIKLRDGVHHARRAFGRKVGNSFALCYLTNRVAEE